MAAEVLANDLGLDLYRIDLAGVVSKYIGETEKNLRRLFDAAERTGSVLLFDEADALFGKRTEVTRQPRPLREHRDQLPPPADGGLPRLAILATNRRSLLDHAFLRRLRFILDFPFPDRAGAARDLGSRLPAGGRRRASTLTRWPASKSPAAASAPIAINAAFFAAEDGDVYRDGPRHAGGPARVLEDRQARGGVRVPSTARGCRMSRVVISVGSVRVSGLDRADATALPGRLEGAVARSLTSIAAPATGRSADVRVVRVRLDKAAKFGPDQVGPAVADAIRSAVQGRGASR